MNNSFFHFILFKKKQQEPKFTVKLSFMPADADRDRKAERMNQKNYM